MFCQYVGISAAPATRGPQLWADRSCEGGTAVGSAEGGHTAQEEGEFVSQSVSCIGLVLAVTFR